MKTATTPMALILLDVRRRPKDVMTEETFKGWEFLFKYGGCRTVVEITDELYASQGEQHCYQIAWTMAARWLVSVAFVEDQKCSSGTLSAS